MYDALLLGWSLGAVVSSASLTRTTPLPTTMSLRTILDSFHQLLARQKAIVVCVECHEEVNESSWVAWSPTFGTRTFTGRTSVGVITSFRADFVVRQFAILIFVHRFQSGDGISQLFSRDFAVLVNVESLHEGIGRRSKTTATSPFRTTGAAFSIRTFASWAIGWTIAGFCGDGCDSQQCDSEQGGGESHHASHVSSCCDW